VGELLKSAWRGQSYDDSINGVMTVIVAIFCHRLLVIRNVVKFPQDAIKAPKMPQV
jgi:hypothetical protein